ncbi:uncharacterized protein LOC115620079 isoform X2 [Scaptodrosophila lebanonensis]|uniref:Uncharacterized protein LOC115620079 isoform X2 n=2 Tax=Drosophila lebanonensis TaxID=7225 RepID=A0A6J2T2J6_DROLE|nr:uncharacterized protein LOC115620079 isoform X2 [Scaptodrosophila lebanonensis]
MPNNRNRNRNRNRNKRNKNQNQNNNNNGNNSTSGKNKQQPEEVAAEEVEVETEAAQLKEFKQEAASDEAHNANSGNISNVPATTSDKDDDRIDAEQAVAGIADAADTHENININNPRENQNSDHNTSNNNQEDSSNNHDSSAPLERSEEGSASATVAATIAVTAESLNSAVNTGSVMGAKSSKKQQDEQQPPTAKEQEQPQSPERQSLQAGGSPKQAKVIVHRIVREQEDAASAAAAPASSPSQQRSTKVIIHQIRLETDEEERKRKGKLQQQQQQHEKPHIEEIHTAPAHSEAGTLSPTPRYLVESPKNVASSSQFSRFARDLQIQELNGDLSSGEFNVEQQSPLVSEVESETETSTTPTTTTSPTNVPTTSPELQQLPSSREEQRLKRAQKRNALESHFLPQLLSPRYLDSILEENSDAGSEYALSRSASNNTSNEERAHEALAKLAKAMETFPRSQLDFSRRHKRGAGREEPVALKLETKLLEQPGAEEACSRLESTLSPQSEDAELVYLSSSGSSSISDLMELELEQAAALAERTLVDLDTDASALIERPGASIGDDDSTTTEPATSSNDTETEVETEVETESRESTPVNQLPSVASSRSSLYATAQSERTTPTPTTSPTPTLPAPQPTANEVSKLEVPRESEQIDNEQTLSAFAVLDAVGKNRNASASFASSAATDGECESGSTGSREKYVRRSEIQTTETTSTTFETNADMDKMRELVDSLRQSEEAAGVGMLAPPVPPPPTQYTNAPPTDSIDSHTTPTQFLLKRQESCDSHCSDSTQHSQCTAIHVASPPPTFASPTPVSPATPTATSLSPQPAQPTSSHCYDFLAKEQQQQLEQPDTFSDASGDDSSAIKKLRLLCTETVASMPYGEQVLEELANVAQNIGEVRAEQQQQQQSETSGMPYPLPDLPHIGELQLSLSSGAIGSGASKAQPAHTVAIAQPRSSTPPPPPIPAPPNNYDAWLGLPTDADPKLLVCLSPGQRALINEQSTPAADQLLDAHQKFVERRGYHELSAEQVRAINSEKLEQEQQILKTAAIMKQLRKSLTPTPPPVPPPPVPVKSSETAAKAKPKSSADTGSRSVQVDDARDGVSVTPFANSQQQLQKRLDEILQQPTHSNGNANGMTTSSPSSHENNSRRPADKHDATAAAAGQREPPALPLRTSTATQQQSHSQSHSQTSTSSTKSHSYMSSSKNSSGDAKFPSSSQPSAQMQSMESELARLFPSIAQQGDIFAGERKRFSNIEPSNQQPWSSQPKRYSNIETSSYESKKRTENGQVVYDYSNSSHEKKEEGEKPPITTSTAAVNSEHPKEVHIPVTRDVDEVDCAPPVPPPPSMVSNGGQEQIMSALKLNGTNTPRSTFIDQPATTKSVDENRNHESRNESESVRLSSTFKKDINNTYEEFRQRAKAAAEALGMPAEDTTTTAPATENATTSKSATSTTNAKPNSQGNYFDHENLFKDFDALSQQLHTELETGRAKREQRDKSSSLYDLSRLTCSGKQQLEQLKQRRHEHMMELEREIERSARARQERMSVPRNFESPGPRTYEIPVQVEANYDVKSPPPPPPPPQSSLNENGPRYRRAESMCNLTDARPHSSVGHYGYNYAQPQQDDWGRYANDLGYSENIARPFAREVEICYQRQNPRGTHSIRAPRLSVSTNDLSTSSHQSYDTFNAYGGRRTHAPMLSQAPQQQRPHYASCYSMIERNPNPTYISTTSRRGVSPAPHPQPPPRPMVAPPEYDRQRRSSLPRELHEQQLKYIQSKEQELKMEFERLENERRRLLEEIQRAPQIPPPQRRESYRPAPKLPTLTEDEVFRQQMAEEWLNKVAEREERRLHKIIKISKIHDNEQEHTAGANAISDEFLDRVKQRRTKLSMPADSDWESGAESQPYAQAQASESDVEVPPVRIIEGKSEANLRQLPRHLREFAKFSNHETQQIEGGQRELHEEEERREEATDNSLSSATKKSSVVKTYKVSRLPPSVALTTISKQEQQPLEEGTKESQRRSTASVKLPRHKQPQQQQQQQPQQTAHLPPTVKLRSNNTLSSRKQTRFLLNAQQLQKQRQRRSWSESDLLKEIDNELQLAKGFLFANVYKVKHEYMSEPETDSDRPRKMAQLGRRQYEGIGPVTNDGMPIILRSEVQEPHQHEWYKRLYQTIHKQKNGDDFVIRYKCPRARPTYKASGYVSEPEPNYDSDYSTVRYRTYNPHRMQSVSSAVNVRNLHQDENLYGTMPNPIKSTQNSYKNQPGRIENYTTGHSSVSEKEKKEWWDEVMDIFNGNLEQSKLSPLYTEGNLSRALAKESGYTSDSNLVFRKKELPQSSPLSPVEQKQAYKSLQAGGEPPLLGFRKPAPEKPKDFDSSAPPIPPQPPAKGLISYDQYSNGSDVNIHFKTPIRHEYKQSLSEEELARNQAEHMQKLYQEERRRKYLQELQDMNSRRHTDNFTPSQKSPIALNRYDDFPTDVTLKSLVGPKTVARALYNFQGQSSKELSFRKGDTIYIRRQIDANWYEGEHNAMIGLLPVSYVEIVSRDGARTPAKRPSEGQARAKYNFQAQSGIELSLNKGELVTLTRRVDGNWFEGKIANRKGIFPVSYVEILTDIGAEDIAAKTTTVISSHSTTNLRPTLDVLRTNINNEFNTLTQNGAQPPNGILKETKHLHKTDALHVDTSTEPLAYRALYKYRPQNSDELELLEGDLVHVLEKCDDGWFVGTSQRTGCFGTFPGNYVERA